jgi:sporulation protein YlmC with PRC-barrel domain
MLLDSAATRSTLSASTLIGDSVNNRAGENVGSLKDIMLDLEAGRIAYAVVSCGGFLGIGEKLFAVPWNALELDSTNHAIIFDIDRERLMQAPGFDKDNWPDMGDRTWGTSVHEFYGTRPYWE